MDGNLSSADMQAISDVVTQVNSLATQFFSGDVQDAFAAAASLNVDPGEIAGFSMKLSYSSTLIQQASATGAAPGAGSTTPGAPTGSQSTPGAATGANSTSAASGSSPAAGSPDSSTASTSQPAANPASAAAQGATSVAAATPQVASNRYPTLQAARLAADTLSQLAQ